MTKTKCGNCGREYDVLDIPVNCVCGAKVFKPSKSTSKSAKKKSPKPSVKKKSSKPTSKKGKKGKKK